MEGMNMWPFKKKHERINKAWLNNHRIQVTYDDAFNMSKGELKKEVSRLSEEIRVWDTKKQETEKAKAQLQLTMSKLIEASEGEDLPESKKNDLRVKLLQQDNEFREEVENYLNAQNKGKELENTRWLLEKILNGTFKDPKRLTEPPIVKTTTWRDIFDNLPEIDQMDEEYLNEVDDYFGIGTKKDESNEPSNHVTDDVDNSSENADDTEE